MKIVATKHDDEIVRVESDYPSHVFVIAKAGPKAKQPFVVRTLLVARLGESVSTFSRWWSFEQAFAALVERVAHYSRDVESIETRANAEKKIVRDAIANEIAAAEPMLPFKMGDR